jgi:hypothetical protein
MERDFHARFSKDLSAAQRSLLAQWFREEVIGSPDAGEQEGERTVQPVRLRE